MKRMMALLTAVAISAVSFAAPTISDLKVTPISPLGLAIDYTISDATSRDLTRPIDVTMTVGGKNYIAKTLLGETKCENGSHRVYWNMAKDGLSIDAKDAVVTVTYKLGEVARYCVIDLSAGASDEAEYPVVYVTSPPSGGFTNRMYKTTKLVLRRVDANTFTMGNSQQSSNRPHDVVLTKPYYIGIYEVTQKQWMLVTGKNPCFATIYGKGETYPVHYVSYDMIRGTSDGAKWPETNSVDSVSFLGKLRDRTKLCFDLPTEAQWECACRAGTTTEYSYGDSADGAYMWYYDNSPGKAQEVGTKLPNRWGFYDMLGNVMEWCLDWHVSPLSSDMDPVGGASGLGRVARGGSWNDNSQYCSSSYRTAFYSTAELTYGGFRLAGEVPLGLADVIAPKIITGVSCRVIADGAEVDGSLTIGAAPMGVLNAVVAVDDEPVLTAAEATMVAWNARTLGRHTITHSVGGISMSATYNVTTLVDPVPAVAADGDVAAALDGTKDGRLAEKVTTAAKYTAYRTWVDGVAGTDLADTAVVTKRQAIKDASHAWLGYALDLGYDAAVTLGPKQGDLVVATFTISAAGGGTPALPSGGAAVSADGAWTLTVALDGVSVGANATAANLAEAFVVEGATTLDGAAFSSSSVTATFAPTGDGKVSITIKPADATAQTFFIRVKLTQ